MRVKFSIYILAIVAILLLYILSYRISHEGFTENKVYVFYHIYCNKNTLDVVKEQTSTIIDSGLYERVDAIYCFLTGSAEDIDTVSKYISTLSAKFIIKATGVDDMSYERFTLNKITETIQENDKFLYIHTKGVASLHPSKNDNIILWRKYMQYQLIERFQECLDGLDTYDVVGVAYATRLIGPHFSGNFWWSTGSYYRKLNKSVKIGDDYFEPESYLFKNNPKYLILDHTVPLNTDIYNMPIYPHTYRKI
jgi:hypothetical protein